MADVEVLKVCPFDGGNAELRIEHVRTGYGEYEQHNPFHYVECMSCGARSRGFSQQTLASFTNYTVADFRDNPILRANVEDEYKVYVDGLKHKAIALWNKRIR